MNTWRQSTVKPSALKAHMSRKKNSAAFIIKKGFDSALRAAKIRILPVTDSLGSLMSSEKKLYLHYAAIAVISLLFGTVCLPGGIYPFGTAILCAMRGKDALFAFIGTGASSVLHGEQALVHFLTCAIVYIARRAFTRGGFDESPQARLIDNAAANILVGIVKCGVQFSAEGVFSSLAAVFISAAAAYLFSCFFSLGRNGVSMSAYALSLLSLSACTVMALEPLKPFGISLGLICACMITLFFAKANGLIYGGVAGLICGFACADTVLSASLGIAGLISGALFAQTFISPAIFCVISVLSVTYLSGFEALRVFAPEIAAACICFIPLSRFTPDFLHVTSPKSQKPKNARPMTKSEFGNVGDCLGGLSSVFFKLSERLKYPAAADTDAVIKDAFDENCAVCSMSEMCYAKKQCDMQDI